MNVKQKTGEVREDIRFRLSRNNRQTVSSWLNKREDLTVAERQSVLDYLDTLDDATTQLAAGKWFVQGTVRLPEDMDKIEQAVAVAKKAKVDVMRYKSPMEVIESHADIKIKAKPINPDTVSTLTNKREIGNGITIYDVEDSKQGQADMRKIINTHFGEECSPWCLLQGDGNGNLREDSWEYWNHYNAYPKQVAFKDGKLTSFSASDSKHEQWWDKQDVPHDGVPVIGKLKGDEKGNSEVN